jgi:hypothetical protein
MAGTLESKKLKLPKLTRHDPSEVVVLAGAGVSTEEPSGIPAAWGLLEALLRWVAPRADARADLARRMMPGHQFNPYHFLRFEGFIQAIAQIDPNIFYYLESTQTFGGPNVNHRLLARMAIDGATVLTTNFDTRIEQAIGNRRLSTFVLSSKRRAPSPMDRLIKIHGSFPWMRGRNVTPRATLTQIGKLGLGFERFPEFQDWFRALTTGKHLIVIGYSASDSFDVVPLIENCSNARTVTWFSYQSGRRGLRVNIVRSRKSRAPFPFERSTDFAAHTLKRLAELMGPACEVYRIYGGSVQTLLKKMVCPMGETVPAAAYDNLAGPRNLSALHAALSESPLSARQRRAILSLIDDGMFGESYATDVEARPVRRGNRVIFVESNTRFGRATPEWRANTALRAGDPDSAFRILEEAARKTADASQILLLLHHFEFRFGEQHRDVRRLDRAISKTERVSRQSGALWGLIMAEWMKSFRLEAEWRMMSDDRKKSYELSRQILAHAERTIYYGVRAGWQTWFATAARLAAKHSVALGEFDKGESYLKSLLTWLDRETPDGAEETAGTACALNALGIRSGRRGIISTARLILSELDAGMCPVVKLLRIAAEAEVAHARRQWSRFARLERSANEHILKLDPADHWNVKGVFGYLRHASTEGRGATHAGD